MINRINSIADFITIEVLTEITQTDYTKGFYFNVDTDTMKYIVIELEITNNGNNNHFYSPNWFIVTFSVLDFGEPNSWIDSDFKDMDC